MSLRVSPINAQTGAICATGSENVVGCGWAAGQLISIIQSNSRLVGASFAFGLVSGVGTAWAIDNLFHKYRSQLPTSGTCGEIIRKRENLFHKRVKISSNVLSYLTISAIAFTIFLTMVTGAAITPLNVACVALVVGFTLGTQITEHCQKTSDSRIEQFVQELKKFNNGSVELYVDDLRLMDMGKMKKCIEAHIPLSNLKHLNLEGTLVDSDLRLLGEAGWFDTYERIILSQNDRLTGYGLQWIGKNGCRALKELRLDRCNLTDEDLEQMAETGCFDGLETLMLRCNPCLTCKGLAAIARRGCNKLTKLDVSLLGLFSAGLHDWIEAKGFSNLKILDLSNTGIKDSDLSTLVNECDWFKNLTHLDLSANYNLTKLPYDISQMTNLNSLSVYNCYKISTLNRGILILVCRGIMQHLHCGDVRVMKPLWKIYQEKDKEYEGKEIEKEALERIKMQAMCEAIGLSGEDI